LRGYFGTPGKQLRKDGTYVLRVRASATQHGEVGIPAHVLIRLRETLGGRIERYGEPDDFKWVLEGVDNVRRLFESLSPWLGEV